MIVYGLIQTMLGIISLKYTQPFGAQASYLSNERIFYLTEVIRQFDSLIFYWGMAALTSAAIIYIRENLG